MSEVDHEKVISFIFFSCYFSSASQAFFYAGSKLYGFLERDMRGSVDFEVGLGDGYVIGVYDAIDGVLVCCPVGVTVKQVKHVVFNYMQKHPESWDKSADISVVSALREVWSCQH